MKQIDILQAMKGRRSIHLFKKERVSEELLKEIFTYASWAPTHYMKEPWNIKLYEQEGRNKLIDATIRSYQRLGMLKSDGSEKALKSIESIKQFLLEIPHHAVIYLPIEQDPVRYEEEYAAVCAFIQNTQLAAWKHGVGMLWTITPYMHDPQFLQEIGLHSDREKIAAVMQIGYPKKIPKRKERTPIEEKLEVIYK
ncbi:nitroreductase [Pseudogracilibacillus auburnensis]|uniref:Nitroreductase n=1 Tax=Pseudogracilibacillus auburnensis TaxID=1494959 RepID=A0A2V3VK85_9BACI|nr:nitroreductase [Pseudogracilibacillus auburnensis]PXW80445.1 nitroreductase [Pseudogracilibacillus auburnensis]